MQKPQGKKATPPTVRKKREFGDHMAGEAETSHIPHIVCTMYATIVLYSYLASLVTGDPWYTQCIFYFVVLVLFYAWHWLAHQKFSGAMYKIHMEHHLKSFPPSLFYGKPGTVKMVYGFDVPTMWNLLDPRRSTNFTFAHEGPLYIMLAIAVTVARVVVGCSWPTIAFFLAMSVTMGLVGSALHSSFHVKDFQLEGYQWYRELRTLHYLHHLGNMQHNYAVLNLGLDWFFRSLALIDPVQTRADGAEGEASAWEDLLSKIKKEDLPQGITLSQLNLARQSAGTLSSSLFAAIPHQFKTGHYTGSAIGRGYPTVLLRILLIGFTAWFWMKGAALAFDWLGGSAHPVFNAVHSSKEIYDLGHQLLLPLRTYLEQHNPTYLLHLVNIKMALSDLMALFLIGLSLLGPTFRPAMGGIFALILRFLSQSLTRFVAEPSSVYLGQWEYPTLFASTATSGSFISPHVIVATVFLIESFRFDNDNKNQNKNNYGVLIALWRFVAVVAVVFQIVSSLVLHSNWTFDILLALLLTRYTTIVAKHYSLFIDTVLP